MSSPADLPGRTSKTHDLNDLQQRVQQESSNCGTSSLFKQFLNTGSSKLRAIPHRYLRHGFIALSIPAALLAGTIIPAAQQSSLKITPVAAAYAVQSGLGAFQGDSAVADEAIADEFVFTETQSALGAPVSARYAPVAVEVANLRSGPAISYQRLGKLVQGQTVRLLGRNGEWYQVETNSGQTGWIHGELVTVNAAATKSLAVVNVAPAKAKVGTTTEANVNLRTGPSTDYKVITKLPTGISLEVLGQQGGWVRVATPKGTVGWITDDFFKSGQAAAAAPAKAASNGAIVARVGESRVNLRKGPNTAFGSFGKMAEGTQITVLARNGSWLKVRSPRGTIGWIAKDLVQITNGSLENVPVTKDVPALPKVEVKPAAPAAPAAQAAPSVAASGDAASIALRYVGARYVYGGSGPGGFDCSGLTSFVYRQIGINLPHKASAQFSTRYGQKVGFGDLAAGDLVFFANTAGRGITHVALYVGGGMMVSANTPRTGVQYVSINSNYWRSHYAGAIRPFR
ncbi:MAG: SH3 domain-containing protein [Chloroflexi bacterium]|nr:SH3 domain-containing protein [Chloroflexota bacterium]